MIIKKTVRLVFTQSFRSLDSSCMPLHTRDEFREENKYGTTSTKIVKNNYKNRIHLLNPNEYTLLSGKYGPYYFLKEKKKYNNHFYIKCKKGPCRCRHCIRDTERMLERQRRTKKKEKKAKKNTVSDFTVHEESIIDPKTIRLSDILRMTKSKKQFGSHWYSSWDMYPIFHGLKRSAIKHDIQIIKQESRYLRDYLRCKICEKYTADEKKCKECGIVFNICDSHKKYPYGDFCRMCGSKCDLCKNIIPQSHIYLSKRCVDLCIYLSIEMCGNCSKWIGHCLEDVGVIKDVAGIVMSLY